MNRRKFLEGLIFFALVFTISLLLWHVFLPKENSKLTKQDFLTKSVKSLNYVAIGDSLTEGIGDTTNQGGFVPLLAESLEVDYGYKVTTKNYGVAGNTSQQILNRMSKEEVIQSDLKAAGLMTLTVGGNDVMAVIRKNLTNLNVSSFVKPVENYQKRLRQIIDLARADNPDLPIYILGIYNPFYLNFPEMTDMQTVVDDWNIKTEEVAQEYDGVYFVAINDLLYKGLDGQGGISQGQSEGINDLLFSEDNFHPNNTGYRIMSTAVMEKMSETDTKWKN